MKKLVALLAALLSSILIVTACSTSTPAPAAATTTQPSAAKPAAPSSAATSPSTTNPVATTVAATKPAVTTPATTTPANKYGGILRTIEPVSATTPIGIPWETSGNSVLFMQLALQAPVKEQIDGAITPNLAASFDVVTDPANPSITFHFQKGVKFSDGTDFNAQAVKWNYDQIIASNMYPNVTSYWKSLEVLDDYTLKINMTTWLNKALASFGNSLFVISPTAFQKSGLETLRWQMVGTGPFMQAGFQRDVSLTTVKNPNYWEQGKPYVDKIQILSVADEMTRLALFKSGGADVLNTNGSGRIAQDFQNAGYKIITQPAGTTILIPDSLNADSPWSNQKVRYAADYALDRESIAKAFGYGYWNPVYQLSNPTSLAYDKNLPGRKYDVAMAKQLLTEAGYPNGFKTTLIAQNNADTNMVAAIQSYLGKVGIQCEIQMAAAGLFTTYSNMGALWKNAIILNTQTAWANPTTGINGSFGIPSTGWQSTAKPPGWKDTLTAAMTSTKLEPALLQKVEDMAYDYAMVIPLYAGSSMWVANPNVQDSGIGTRASQNWWEPQNVWLSK